ncbi:MAG: excinuclease ABC subunit UvrB [bacterium]
MKFKLHSQFKPTGDQPQAIKKLVEGYNKYPQQTLLGVTGSGKTFTMANVIEKLQKPTLVLAPNKTLAGQLYNEFKMFFPENKVCYFISYYDYYQPESYLPQIDTYIEKDTSINEKIEQLRLEAAMALIEREDVIVVASVSCIYGFGSPENFKSRTFKITKGERLDRDDLVRELILLHYERNDMEISAGKFQVRGEVINLVSGDGRFYIRAEFNFDEVKKIKFFRRDALQCVSTNKPQETDEIFIFPANPFIFMEDQNKAAIVSIRKELEEELKKIKDPLISHRLKQRVNYDLEMIKELGFCNGIENYSRHFDGRNAGEPPYSLLDYFRFDPKNPPSASWRTPLRKGGILKSPQPPFAKGGNIENPPNPPLRKGGNMKRDFLFIIDESHIALPQVHGMYGGDYSRKKNLIDYGFRLPSAFDNRPLKFEEFEKYLDHVIYTSATPGDYEFASSGQIAEQIVRPTGVIDPEVFVRPTQGQIDDLMKEIEKSIKLKNRVLITTLTKRMSEDLTDYLLQKNIKAKYLHSEIDTMKRTEIIRDLRLGKFDVLVGINLLREGLDIPEVGLVAIMDADKEGFLRNEKSLIQTIGRAARNVDAKVILYADKETGSIKQAIAETDRRREIQKEYNRKHNITPQSIKKDIQKELIRETEEAKEDKTFGKKIKGAGDVKKLIINFEAQMRQAAEELDFEKAIELREKVREIKGDWGLS